MKKPGRLEAVLWNIAFPGFCQLLMRQYVKGIIFIALEFIMNVSSSFNQAIMYSFLGEISRAEAVVNYQWLMFYPCVYMFSLWDAYRSAMPEDERFSYLPFVFCAYFVTVGLMVSPKMNLFGVHPGPVFLPMLFLLPGLCIGFLLKFLLSLRYKSQK
jgi:hypothetical protein